MPDGGRNRTESDMNDMKCITKRSDNRLGVSPPFMALMTLPDRNIVASRNPVCRSVLPQSATPATKTNKPVGNLPIPTRNPMNDWG